MLAFRCFGAAVVVLLLAACSGSTSVPAAVSNSNAGAATFTFAMPLDNASSAVRSPRYISLRTESFTILTDGRNPQTINVNASSPNCRAINNGGSLSCAITVSTTAGTHDFTVTSYTQIDGAGSALSTNTTGPIVVDAAKNTAIAIALEGIVAGAVLTFRTAMPVVGTPAVFTLTVVLKDAAGAIIIGSAPFSSPITLTSSDALDGPLVKTVLNAPADETGITANYNGANVAHITYSATGSGLAARNVTNAVLTPASAGLGAKKIYLTNSVTSGVTTYNADGSPGTPTFTSPLLTTPIGIAVDAGGKIYVADTYGGPAGGNVRTYSADGVPSTPSITAGLSFPTAIAVGATGKIYVANYGNPQGCCGNITTYNADGTQTATITAGLGSPTGVAVDAAGKMYVASNLTQTVTTYNADGSQTTPTIALGQAFTPAGIAVDTSGKIYLVNSYTDIDHPTGSIVTYNPNGTPAALTITGLTSPGGVAVDTAGKIYVVNQSSNDTVTTYNADGTQTAPTIVTGQLSISGIAVH